MICPQWKMHVVILWLLGGCIGSLIKDKSPTFGLAAETTYYHDLSPTDHHRHLSEVGGGRPSSSVKYLHSSSKKRDQNIHSVSSSSSSSSNSVYQTSGNSASASSTSQSQLHNNYHQHHHNQHPNNYRTIIDDTPSDDDFTFVHGYGPDHPRDSSSPNLPGVQEKLRSTKGATLSSFGGSTIGGGSGSSSSSSSTGLDHHHLHQHQQRERHHQHQSQNPEDYNEGGGDGSNNFNINTNLGSESIISGSGAGTSESRDDQEKSYIQSQHHSSSSPHQNQVPREQQEKLLLQQLMRGYERDVRPVRNASQAVVVRVGITLTQIFDMDEKNQVLTTNVWLDQEWNDELLRWDPEDFGGLEMIRIPCERVDVTNRTEEIDLDNYVTNGEWDLLRADIQRNVVRYPCCTEPFPDVTITLVIRRKTLYYIYNIVLPCMMLSALTLLVFCLPPDSGEKIALGITVLLAFSVFMLAISEALPETSESIPLIGIYLTAVMAITSISVIVTVVVLNLHYLGPRVRPVPSWLKCLLPEDDLNFIRQKSLLIPATHREPRSGSLKRGHVYIPAGSDKNTNNTSAYAEDALHECSSTESVTKERTPPPAYGDALDYTTQEQRFRKRQRHRSRSNPGTVGASSVPSTSAHNNAVSVSTMTSGSASSTQTTMAAAAIAAAAARRSGTGAGFIYPHMQGGGSTEEANGAGKDSMSMCEDLVNAVRYLMSIQEQVEHQNIMVAEWRLVAQAVDRILFWIFAVMTIFSSTVLLLILPLYKRSTYYGPPNSANDVMEDALNETSVE